jgi:AraC-like DNA-binding protein
MKNAVPKISFGKLATLFEKSTNKQRILKFDSGQGYIQIFRLEEGLRARIWKCQFRDGLEVYNAVNSTDQTHFTLAFFPAMKGLKLADSTDVHPKNEAWDTVFASAGSGFRVALLPQAKGHCLSIHIAKEWFSTNLFRNNESFNNLREKIDSATPFLLFEAMSSFEKKQVEALLDHSWEKCLGTFYIKTCVLNIIYNFFSRINDACVVEKKNIHLDTLLTEVENTLCAQVTGKLPNLKALANRYLISESTLKRHFFKRFGLTMSAHFMKKKMTYAHQLMQENNATIAEIAGVVGYRNSQNFLTMYKKCQSLL